MAKYRKLPVEIEAVQIGRDWDNWDELLAFCGGAKKVVVDDEVQLVIETLEGDMRAREGDYIIKGIQGEFYPCKPDIFVQTYERVESD